MSFEMPRGLYTHSVYKPCPTIRLSRGDYTFKDSLGSPVTGTTSAGSISWRERYTPYGEKLLDPAANRDEPGYTGHIQDDATGLTYMQARYYDPVIGRFLSIDPVGFSPEQPFMFNRYVYVGNDPVNLIDPNGRIPILISLAIFIAKEVAAEVASRATGGVTDVLSVRRLATRGIRAAAKRLATNNRRGAASEARKLNERGLEKNNKRFSGPEGDTIPDAIDPKTGNLVEVKDTKTLSRTKQLRNQSAVAEEKGVKVEIDTGTNTKVEKPLSDDPNMIIKRHDDLGNGN